MAGIKTQKTSASVSGYIERIVEKRRPDAKKLLKIFKDATGLKPSVWSNGMIGFGSYHYKSDRSSQEGDWPLTAFAVRKSNMTIYIMSGVTSYPEHLQKLGRHAKSAGSCLYITSLSDINEPTLTLLIKASVRDMKKRYGRAR